MADADDSPFDGLCKQLGRDFANIRQARMETADQLAKIDSIVTAFTGNHPDKIAAADTSFIAFGSLARREWTGKSDLDWTLLIDGKSNPHHFQLVQLLSSSFVDGGYPSPGTTQTFGQMTSSHELIHHIGGVEDTNQNLTRRILLLLESIVVGNAEAHERVLGNLLIRYLSLSGETHSYKTPRFLLNDIVRFWRTMAVDYAAKKWRDDRKWAIRNLKLRFSRKIIFIKGLLLCLRCELIPKEQDGDNVVVIASKIQHQIQTESRMTPIDLLAQQLIEIPSSQELATEIFDCYDQFLAILNDELQRGELEILTSEGAEDSKLFQEVKKLGRKFEDATIRLFFDADPTLSRLVKKYGVF